MSSAAFASVLANLLSVLFLFVAGYIYWSLFRQINARPAVADESVKTFGLPEAIAAALLIGWLVLNVIVSLARPSVQLTTHDLLVNLVFTVGFIGVIAGFLKLRGFDLNSLAGFSKIGVVRAVVTGALLLLCAYPLIMFAERIMQFFIGSGSSKQNIVELFNGSQTLEQRILIIIFAVGVAPIAEEFIFRFFLYGVLKRYFGIFLALAINAILFAGVHAHLPSFAPLFVLGACFTIAYEWSGSILVSMTMHSVFNSLTLVILAFPEMLEQ